MKTYFVTGIGTDVGKTVTSAILVKKLSADYWKPVQTGSNDGTDTQEIKSLLQNSVITYQESYCLKEPLSPHAAAKLEDVEISTLKILGDFSKIEEQRSERNLIIEGAGGLMVPLNSKDLFIDLLEKLDTEVILVSKNYLGSINHTLMTIEVLNLRCINVAGIIFIGNTNKESEDFILEHSKLPCIGRIPFTETVNREFIVDMQSHITL